MGRLTLRPVGAVLISTVLSLAAPSLVAAAPVAWTVVASPLTTTTGTPTTFSMTATNLLLGQIRCLHVDVPENFAVFGSGIISSPDNDSWHTSVTGNRVRVWTNSGGDELGLLTSVKFSIQATASGPGQLAWASRSFADESCTGSSALLSVPPVVVVTGAAVTPTPMPTPVPTPRPTPEPTPTPTPLLPLPSLPPSLPLPSVALPALPSVGSLLPHPTPAASPPASSDDPADPSAQEPTQDDRTPEPAPSHSAADRPQPSETESEVGIPGRSSGGAGGNAAPVPPGEAAPVGKTSRRALAIELPPTHSSLGLAGVDVAIGLGTYAVPGAVLAGPGVLLLLWVALQSGGALAWIPAVRRLRGRDERSRLR